MSTDDTIVRSAAKPPTDVSPRDRLRTRFPLFNAGVTVFTGKPLEYEAPLARWDGSAHWAIETATYFGLQASLLALLQAVPTAGAWGLPIGVVAGICGIAVVGRLRKQQVTFGHHAVHNEISKAFPFLNKLAKVVCTALPLAQNADEYFVDHLKMHHRRKEFTTPSDPDAGFLERLGFRSGMTKRQLRNQLLRTIMSWEFHADFFVSRMRSTFVTSNWPHRPFAAAWMLALSSLAFVIPIWAFLLGVVLPFTWGYQTSALLQFASEHKWLLPKGAAANNHEYAERCAGRFSLVPPPRAGLKGWNAAIAWSRWTLRMIPEALVRLGVIVGDLPAHDWHHVVGFIRHSPEDWNDAIYERQRNIDTQGDEYGMSQRECYGLLEALYWAFDARDD